MSAARVSIAVLMDELRESTQNPHPLHDFALPGPRVYYGQLEGA